MTLSGRFPPRLFWRRLVFSVALAAPFLAAAAACSSSSGGEPPCFPPAYSVSPAIARPGEAVTVAAHAADCNPRYGPQARIHVTVTDKSGAEVINTTAPMTDAGEFAYTFTVPAGMAAGEAAVTAIPHNIDWCDDTGRNNRVGRTSNLDRASCAMPVEELTVLREP